MTTSINIVILRRAIKINYWITPIRGNKEQTAEEIVQTLVGIEGIYAFSDRTQALKHLEIGDWLCFYATGKGIVAHAQISSAPKNKPHPKVPNSELYPWTIQLKNECLYLDKPTMIDTIVLNKLEAFKDRDLSKWAWFVHKTLKISRNDFKVLTEPKT